MKKAKPVNSEVVRQQESPDLLVSPVSPVSLKKVRNLELPVYAHQDSPVDLATPTCLPVSTASPATLTQHPEPKTLNRTATITTTVNPASPANLATPTQHPATLMTTIVKIDPHVNTREMVITPTEVEIEVAKVSPEASEVATVVVIAVVTAHVVSTAVDTVALRAKTRVPTLATRDSQDVKVTTTSPEVVVVSNAVALPEAVSPSTVSSPLNNESQKRLKL